MSWFRRGRHAWKDGCHRNMYALVYSPWRKDWVRVFYFGHGEVLLVSLDNEVVT